MTIIRHRLKFEFSVVASMKLNVSDTTCWFGLARTERGCVRTLASYDEDAYLRVQIVYCVLGVLSVIASAIMYCRAVNYGNILPRPITSFLSDSCTAALYSVYILALGYWALIIQKGSAVVDKPAKLRCLETSSIAFVWTFYTAYSMALFASKGFQPVWMLYLQLVVSACVLGAISTTFLVYGLRVLSRLQMYEREVKLRMSSALYERMMPNESFTLACSSDDGGIPIIPEPRYARRQPQEGHATKIKKILFIAESVSIIVMVGQLYMAVSRAATTPVELSCANGKLCKTVKSSVNVLHLLQCACVWVLLWTFRRIKKKNVVPQPIV
ncbi:hypothetical protein PF008_g29167 [Phytophthora fragariae]|uniref:THH1/TOM1/TOM3 domain-containing protein n=1 Tax=Phytophthora fragariae TaxID=53985 RepID=A0A6G0Q984_9STRA|nr:hypothetical protein PF008_g29167 [Phytophthora fragariae]